MSKFDNAIKFFEESDFTSAYYMFYEALNENKNKQLIFPYLAYCAAKENKLDIAKYFLTYPFSNYLITDLRKFEQNLSKDSWADLSIILSELELLGS